MNGIHPLCEALFQRVCPCNQLKTGTRNEAKDSNAQGMIMAPFTTHTSQRSLSLILSAIHDSRAPSHLFVQSHFPGEWQDQVCLAPEPAVNH